MNVFIYGNAQIDERFLNRINEGIEKLTITLLIALEQICSNLFYILIGY